MQPSATPLAPLPTARHATRRAGPAGEFLERAFSERVRNALRPLLTDDAILEKTARNIVKHVNLSPDPVFSQDGSFFDFEGKEGRVVAAFASDGLTRLEYLRAVTQRAAIFLHNPETIINSIASVSGYASA